MADGTEGNSSHKVGYGTPPKRTQFPKGTSGNPKGRPKGSRNFVSVIQDELKKRIPVTEDGKRKKITKREAVAKQLVNKAAAGDPKAIPVLLNETRSFEAAVAAGAPLMESIGQDDQAVLESILKRIREASGERAQQLYPRQ